MLSTNEIKKQIKKNNISISPLKENALDKPNSCIVSLSDELYTFDYEIIDTLNTFEYLNEILNDDTKKLRKLKIPNEGLLLEPNKVYLAKTNENIKTNGFVPVLNGRTSLSLLGISIELNSGYEEDKYDGNLLISIVCTKPTIFYPNIEIGNLTFFRSLDNNKENLGMLSGEEIKNRMKIGDILVNPQDNIVINPNSVNLTLHKVIGRYKEPVLDIKKNNPIEYFEIPDEGIWLYDDIYLARTNEWTETNNLVPMISGRSSLGRLGFHAHCSAGMGSIGYKGYWHLAIRPSVPIKVYKDMKCCQIYYYTVDGEIDKTYIGSMQNLKEDKLESKFHNKYSN